MEEKKLPYDAMIVTEYYREAPANVTEHCIHCHQEMSSYVVFVGVPSMLREGIQTAPNHLMVCSEKCALDWLQSYEPQPLPARNAKSSLADPTSVKEKGWIYAWSEHPGYPLDHPLRSGKWLVFLSEQTIDRYWQRIRDAVIAGKMGEGAKVLTAGSAKRSGDRAPGYTICVYTYDYEDKADVMRIREALRSCGIMRPIRYKRDLDTSLLHYGTDYKPIYEA